MLMTLQYYRERWIWSVVVVEEEEEEEEEEMVVAERL